jgi:hypothetical protein
VWAESKLLESYFLLFFSVLYVLLLLDFYHLIYPQPFIRVALAPEKRGRVQKDDLSAFISRTCRSFGVLLALLERDLLKAVIGAFRKLRYG